MTDKHLAVSVEHQAEQSRRIKRLEAENSRMRSALTLIAAEKRADGTYNRCREACEQLAKSALEKP